MATTPYSETCYGCGKTVTRPSVPGAYTEDASGVCWIGTPGTNDSLYLDANIGSWVCPDRAACDLRWAKANPEEEEL